MQYIPIGKIINTHGLKGEVKIESWSDFDEERYTIGNTVYLETEEGILPLIVKSYRVHKGFPLVSFKGYEHINDVEKYKTCVLYMDAKDRQPLPDGKHYVDQLIGLSVQDEEKQLIGKIIAVEETNGAQKNFRVIKEDGKEILIPDVPAFIKDVDMEEKMMTIHVIEGLL